MAWSTIYITILMSHSEEWLTAKKQAASRAKLLTAVAKEIIAHREENHPDEGPLLNLEKVGLPLSWPIHIAHPDYTENNDLVPEQCQGRTS